MKAPVFTLEPPETAHLARAVLMKMVAAAPEAVHYDILGHVSLESHSCDNLHGGEEAIRDFFATESVVCADDMDCCITVGNEMSWEDFQDDKPKENCWKLAIAATYKPRTCPPWSPTVSQSLTNKKEITKWKC